MALADLLTKKTLVEVRASLRQAFIDAAIDVTAWITGSDPDAIEGVFALGIYLARETIDEANKAQFLDTAYDPGDPGFAAADEAPGAGWLSAKGEGDYGAARGENTFAVGEITLTNAGTQTHQIELEQLTFAHEVTGKTYRNTTPLTGTLSLAPATTLTLDIRAEEPGSASNAAAGEITSLVSTLVGVTVSNVSPVLGTDREERSRYIRRCRLEATAISPNGPAQIYESIALKLHTDGSLDPESQEPLINVNRVHVSKDSTLGRVIVVVASEAGEVDAGEFTTLEDAIVQYAQPGAVTVFVENATEIVYNVTYTAYATPGGASEQAIKDAVEAAVIAYASTIPIGGYSNEGAGGTIPTENWIARILSASASLGVYSVTGVLPLDLTPAYNEVFVLGTVDGIVLFE